MGKFQKILKLILLCTFIATTTMKLQMKFLTLQTKNMTGELESSIDKKTHTYQTNQKKQKDEIDKDLHFKDTLDDGYTIMGDSGVNISQMTAFYRASGHTYPAAELGEGGAPTIEDYCQIFLEESQVEGVRAEIPYVQSMKETGWLQFEGVCDINQYNFAGLGATGGDVAGESYPDVRTGIRAQVQHLKAYATADSLSKACVDTRYDLVKKASAPYVQWLGQQENPEGCGWAVDTGYGLSIAEMIQNLKSF